MNFYELCCFLHWIQSANPHFFLAYITMDLNIFVIAEWATLMVDIRSPQGGSRHTIPIHFSGLAELMSADIARNL